MKRPPRSRSAPGEPAAADATAALAAMRDRLRDAAAAQARAHAQAEAARREQEQAQQTFRAALSDVTPLQHAAKVTLRRARTLPTPTPAAAPPRPASPPLSDGLPSLPRLDQDAPPWQAPGVGPDIPKRLARGDWPLEATLDLHGLTAAQARDALAAFIEHHQQRGARCLRIVHGKGLGSVDQAAVLRGQVPVWLSQLSSVMAFCQAPARHGGRGATLVRLVGPSRRL